MRQIFGRVAAATALLGAMSAPTYAGTVSLALAGQNTGTSNDVIYNWVDQQTTGTGVIDPFLRLQATGTEQGYNSDLIGGSGPMDAKQGSWTHDLQLSDLTVVNIGGVNYYEFLLDINQTNANPLLSLNQVQIYTGPQITSAGALPTTVATLGSLGTLRFDSDKVGGIGAVANDTTVELNYDRNPGSGAGDMLMYVKTSLFAAASANDYVYFYSLFGNANGSNDGFEEWALRVGTASVPDGGVTAFMLGLGMLSIGLWRQKRA